MKNLKNKIRRGRDDDADSNISIPSIYDVLVPEQRETRDSEPEPKEFLYPVDELESMRFGEDGEVLSGMLDKGTRRKGKNRNTKDYILRNSQPCNTIFDKNKTSGYTRSEEAYRNDVIFNLEHERFENGTLDPWLFTDQKDIAWPSYVKNFYYTRLTPTQELVRLSQTTILYFNKLFEYNDYAPVLRIFHYPIYEMVSNLQRPPVPADIRDTFVCEKYVNGPGNVEVCFRDGSIRRDFSHKRKHFLAIPVNEEQPTTIGYKMFHDYIPICFHVPRQDGDKIHFDDPETLFMSNICFHRDGCHDTWCSTHATNHIPLINRHNHVERKSGMFRSLDFKKYINEMSSA